MKGGHDSGIFCDGVVVAFYLEAILQLHLASPPE